MRSAQVAAGGFWDTVTSAEGAALRWIGDRGKDAAFGDVVPIEDCGSAPACVKDVVWLDAP